MPPYVHPKEVLVYPLARDHRDFGDVVASLSLGTSWPMRFRRRNTRPYARDGLPGDEIVTRRDLSRYPWIDFDWPATPSPGDGRPSLDALLERLGETVPTRVKTVLRAGTAGLLLMADGPYLAWLSLTFLDRLPGGFLRPQPVRFGRFRYRTGFVARRSTEDLAPFRKLEAIVRETALGHP